MAHFKHLHALLEHTEQAFKLFYDAMLVDSRLSIFFENKEQIDRLILKQKEHFKATLSMENEQIKQNYIRLGEYHYDLRIPYVDFIKGTDILEEYFLLHTQRVSPSLEIMDDIFSYFKMMKSFTAKGYLNRMLLEDKKDLEEFFLHSSSSAGSMFPRNIVSEKLEWLQKMLNAIESGSHFSIEESGEILENWLSELNFVQPEKRKFFEDLDRRIVLNTHNLFYFLNKEEYLEILPLYTSLLSIYKLTLMMNNAMTIEYANKVIEEMRFDTLTGLYRKDLFEEMVKKEMALVWRDKNHTFTLIYVDLDDFKHVNDTFGHYSGDKVLEKLGETIRTSIRTSDMAFRIGGDEFAIILRKSSQENGKKVAQKIKVDFGSLEFIFNENTVFSVGLSIGVSEYKDGIRFEDFIDNTDKKLYQAKHRGKNQVAF
jgi:diguanylate cyclase (GGDEF)-like protein